MKRALIVAALMAAGGGAEAQQSASCPLPIIDIISTGGSPYYVVKLGTPDDTISAHTDKAKAAMRAGQEQARDSTSVYRVRHTYEGRPVVCFPVSRVDTVPPDTTLPPNSVRSLRIVATPRSPGAPDYSLDAIVADSSGPMVGVAVTFRETGGRFGPGPGPITRTTGGSCECARINWERMAEGDTVYAVAGADTAFFVHTSSQPPPNPTPVPPPPPLPPLDSTVLTPAELLVSMGPLIARSDSASAPIPAFDARFVQTERSQWSQFSANPSAMYLLANHYGGLRSRLQWSIRNGLPFGSADTSTFYGRGRAIVWEYLHTYSAPNNFTPPPHNNTGMPDIEAYWIIERDSVAIRHIWTVAAFGTRDGNNYLKGGNTGSDARQVYVTLQALSAGHRLGVPYRASPWNGNAQIDPAFAGWKDVGNRNIGWLTENLPHPFGAGPWVQANGAVPSPAHSNNEAYLFNAGLAVELFKWWAYVDPSNVGARDLAVRIVRHLADEWERFGRQPLPYLSAGYQAGCCNELAAYHVLPGLIAWQETGEARLRDFATAHMIPNAYDGQLKQWNQKFSTGAQQAEALLAGVRWH